MWASSNEADSSSSSYAHQQHEGFDQAYEEARRASERDHGQQRRRRTHSASSVPTAARRMPSNSHLVYGGAQEGYSYGAAGEDGETQSIKLAGSRPPSRSSQRFARPGGHARVNSTYSNYSLDAQGNALPGASGYLFIDHSIAEASGDESARITSSPRRGKGVMRPGSRIPSAQGLLDEQGGRSPKIPPMPSAVGQEEEEEEERTAALSPEEAWYTLRALVGEVLRAEQGEMWRLRHLDAREDMFGTGGEDDSDDEDIDPRELPISRYLIRHFLLTLPLIRDTLPSDTSNIASDTPAFWAEGLHPIIRALHDADLSHSEDTGELSLGSQIFGIHVRKAVERFISAGLKISSSVPHYQEQQQESTGKLTSPHLAPSSGGWNFQPHLTPPPPGEVDGFSSPDLSAPTTDTESPRRNSRRFSLGNLFRGSSPAAGPATSPPPLPSTRLPTAPSKSPARKQKDTRPISIPPKVYAGPPLGLAATHHEPAPTPAPATFEQPSFLPYDTTSPPPPPSAPPAKARSPSRATGFTSGVEDSASFVSARESAGMQTTDEEEEAESDVLPVPHNPSMAMTRQPSADDATIAAAIRESGWFADGTAEGSSSAVERKDYEPYVVGGSEDEGDQTVQLGQGFNFPDTRGIPSDPYPTAEGTRRAPPPQQQDDFIAHMAIPESAMNGHAHSAHSLAVEIIPKAGAPWPFGASVPFWRGVPVERLKWGGFEADIVGVRNNLFSHSYIIRVRRPARLDEYVVRTDAQFNKYFKVLNKAFPDAHIRRVPVGDPKDDQIIKPRPQLHGNASSGSLATARPSTFRMNSNASRDVRDTQLRSRASQSRLAQGLREAAEDPYAYSSTSPHSSKRNSVSSVFAKTLRAQSLNGDVKAVRGRRNTVSGPPRPYSSMSNRSVGSLQSRLAVNLDFKKLPPHDPRRRALRAWLRDTLSVEGVGHHKETAAFLLLGPVTPRDSDVTDIFKREAIDEARRAARVGVAQGAAQRTRAMRALWDQVEQECIHGDGFVDMSNAIRSTAKIEQLPSRYFKALEAMRYGFAQSLYDLLVGGSSSGTIFGKLVKLHDAFPYFLVRQAFKVGRSKTMAKYLQDLLLARPFGSKSLLQRILAITLDDDPKALLEAVGRLRARIGSGSMCEKLDVFVYDNREKKAVIRRYASDNNLELVLCIIRGSDVPRLPGYELERVARASKRYKAFMKSKPSQLAQQKCDDADVRLVLDLQGYLRLVSKDRDSNVIRSLLGEDDVAHALEVIAAPFVDFLKRTYRVGNASAALGHLETFLDQLIIIVQALRSRVQEPQKSVRILARLLLKHQQHLYDFIRNVHRGDPIIEEFLQWGWTASVFLRRGLAEPVNLDAILPDEVEDKAYLLDEIEELVAFHRKKRGKVYQNTCRRYGGDVDADDPVVVDGDGHGKSRVEPHRETTPALPFLQEIPACLDAFRQQLFKVFAV